MILIFGGAYQGKLDFAKETFGLTDADIHVCSTGEIDFSKRCISRLKSLPGTIRILQPTSGNTGKRGKTAF